MTEVYDRWHKSRPRSGEAECGEHKGKVPTADHGKGKRWQLRYRDADGVQHKENFAKLSDAEARKKVVGGALAAGTHIDPKQGRVTVRAWCEEQWLPSQVHMRAKTRQNHADNLRAHIVPILGARRIGALRRADAKSFVAELVNRGLAPSTVRTVFATLRAALRAAADDGVIGANPCVRIPLPKVERGTIVPLTAEQVTALAAAIDPKFEVAVWLGAGGGLRRGEVRGLLEHRVEFLARRVRVEQQYQDSGQAPLKSNASRRTVPLDDVVLARITEHLRQHPTGEDKYVLTNAAGKPVSAWHFAKVWRDAVKKAGLPTGTRFHDLRHFFACTLIAAGLHPKAIQVRMGHATIKETMDTYGHLWPDSEELGRGAMDKIFTPSALVVPSVAT